VHFIFFIFKNYYSRAGWLPKAVVRCDQSWYCALPTS